MSEGAEDQYDGAVGVDNLSAEEVDDCEDYEFEGYFGGSQYENCAVEGVEIVLNAALLGVGMLDDEEEGCDEDGDFCEESWSAFLIDLHEFAAHGIETI